MRSFDDFAKFSILIDLSTFDHDMASLQELTYAGYNPLKEFWNGKMIHLAASVPGHAGIVFWKKEDLIAIPNF